MTVDSNAGNSKEVRKEGTGGGYFKLSPVT